MQLLFASSLLFDFRYESNQERRLNCAIKVTKSYGKKSFKKGHGHGDKGKCQFSGFRETRGINSEHGVSAAVIQIFPEN